MKYSDKIKHFLNGTDLSNIECRFCGNKFDKDDGEFDNGKWQCPKCREWFND